MACLEGNQNRMGCVNIDNASDNNDCDNDNIDYANSCNSISDVNIVRGLISVPTLQIAFPLFIHNRKKIVLTERDWSATGRHKTKELPADDTPAQRISFNNAAAL